MLKPQTVLSLYSLHPRSGVIMYEKNEHASHMYPSSQNFNASPACNDTIWTNNVNITRRTSHYVTQYNMQHQKQTIGFRQYLLVIKMLCVNATSDQLNFVPISANNGTVFILQVMQ